MRDTFLGEPDLETALTEAIVASVDELRGVPLFTKVLRTEPDALLRTLTTDGGSVIAIVRNSTMSWLGASGGGPLSDEDAEIVAEWITRLGISLILSPTGPIPLDDNDAMRAFVRRYIVPAIAGLAQPVVRK